MIMTPREPNISDDLGKEDGSKIISVFTLNCFGLKFISGFRQERIKAIGEYLSNSNYDIILLQEVWCELDYMSIKSKIYEKFKHSHYFQSGIIGTGMCIFTRVPIQFATFHEFGLNGYPQNVFHGDWFAAKGLGLVQIDLYGFNIHIYVSHYHAEYDSLKDIYIGHRVIHALESSHWIQSTSSSADLTIYAGDFNTEPHKVPYKILKYITPLGDAWNDIHGFNSAGTCETSYNSFTPKHLKRTKPNGQRLDYILYREGPNLGIETLGSSLPLPDRVPNQEFSYSDHEAVDAKIRIWKKNNLTCPSIFKRNLCNGIKTDRVKIAKEALGVIALSAERVRKEQLRYWILSGLCFILLLLTFIPVVYSGKEYYIFIDVALFIPRLLITILFIFYVLMATLFTKKEKHALASTKDSLMLIMKSDNCNLVSKEIAELATNYASKQDDEKTEL